MRPEPTTLECVRRRSNHGGSYPEVRRTLQPLRMVIRRGIALVILARLSSTANSSVYPLLILRVRFSLCPFVAHRCIRANQVCLASIGNAINQTQSIYDAGYCFATSQTIASEKERAIRLSICVATTRPRFFAVLSDLCFGSNGITFWRNACA